MAWAAILWFEERMSVVVYLMRHGIAEEPSRGVSDADRALTDDGVRKTTRVAEGLRALGVVPDAILSSPLRRADETARIAGGILAPDCEITFTPLLAGDTPPEAIAKGLRPPRAARQVMVVGHQPGLGELASYLMTGAADVSPLPFKKAGVAAIEVDALPPHSAGLLHWFLSPGHLRAIADSHK